MPVFIFRIHWCVQFSRKCCSAKFPLLPSIVPPPGIDAACPGPPVGRAARAAPLDRPKVHPACARGPKRVGPTGNRGPPQGARKEQATTGQWGSATAPAVTAGNFSGSRLSCASSAALTASVVAYRVPIGPEPCHKVVHPNVAAQTGQWPPEVAICNIPGYAQRYSHNKQNTSRRPAKLQTTKHNYQPSPRSFFLMDQTIVRPQWPQRSAGGPEPFYIQKCQ